MLTKAYITKAAQWTLQPLIETEENMASWPDWPSSRALTGSTMSHAPMSTCLAEQVTKLVFICQSQVDIMQSLAHYLSVLMVGGTAHYHTILFINLQF